MEPEQNPQPNLFGEPTLDSQGQLQQQLQPEQYAQPSAEITDEDLQKGLANLIASAQHGNQVETVHAFLNMVATSPDTTKTGNLTEDELGLPKLPLRSYKNLALFCNDVANMDYAGDYFTKKAEILTSTSLSRAALLLRLAVKQVKESTETIKMSEQAKQNRGWFKPKNQTQERHVEL